MTAALQINKIFSSTTTSHTKLFRQLLTVILTVILFLCMYIIIIQDLQHIRINLVQKINLSHQTVEINTEIDVSQDTLSRTGNEIQNSFSNFRLMERENVESTISCQQEKQSIKKTYFNPCKELSTYIDSLCSSKECDLKRCKIKVKCSPSLAGIVQVNLNDTIMQDVMKETKHVQPGGWWQPNCDEIRKVAIIIPYRDREQHLTKFLRHMHPYLQKQQLHYRIFIIDQVDQHPFNRGKLLNTGFREALKFFPYDCFVFHDIDLLPEDSRNIYGCLASPQHMCVAIDKFNYRLLYEELFGGVEMFSKSHFELINGFSNSFWGWGAEDDNLYKRLRWKKLDLWRQSHQIGRYKMMKHNDKAVAPDSKRRQFTKTSWNHFHTDGLSSLQYQIENISDEPLYTHIKVYLKKDQDKMFGVMNLTAH